MGCTGHVFCLDISVPSLRSATSQGSIDTAIGDSNAFDEEGLLFGDGELTCLLQCHRLRE